MAGYLEAGRPKFGTVVRAGVVIVVLLAVFAYWPFRSVPTGNRGVITQFGAILVLPAIAAFLHPERSPNKGAEPSTRIPEHYVKPE